MAFEKAQSQPSNRQNLYSAVVSSPAPSSVAEKKAVRRAAMQEQQRAFTPKSYRWTDEDLAAIRACVKAAKKDSGVSKMTETAAIRYAMDFLIRASEANQ